MKIGETVRVDRVHTLMRTENGAICTDNSPDEAEAVARTMKQAKAFQLLKDAGHPVAFQRIGDDGRSLVLNEVEKLLPVRVAVSCNPVTGLKVESKGESRSLSILSASLLSEIAKGAFKTLRRAHKQEKASVTFYFGVGNRYMITYMDMEQMEEKVAEAA